MNLSTTTNGNKIKYKLVLLGDQSVGKSSIIQKYINNKFDDSSNPTVGIDFLAKNILYKSKTFRLQLWDTAGQQRFKSLIPSYLKDAICSIIVYDVTNKASLVNTQKWLKLYKQNKNDGYSILVGNKTDLSYRTVQTQQGLQLANQLKVDHFQISAKTGQNVQQLFFHLIDMMLEGKTNGGNNNFLEGVINPIPEQKKQQQNQQQQTLNNSPKEYQRKKQEKFQSTPKKISKSPQRHQQSRQQKKEEKNIILQNREASNQKKKQNKKSKCC